MIMKEQEKSKYAFQLEALNRRLSPLHKQKLLVLDALKKELSGLKGQNALNFYLGFLPQEEYLIIHNLRLQDANDFFEIDTLILCERYILLIESKNWYGTLHVDGEKQVIRVGDDGREEGFPNPIPQVKTQRHRLQKWLNQNCLPDIPLLYLVVISFPSTILKPLYPNEPIPPAIIHSNSLFFKIIELNNEHTKKIIDTEALKQLALELVNAHHPREVQVLQKFGIKKDELVNGVFCPECGAVRMQRLHSKWYCSACSHVSKNAHVAALQDYKALVGDCITNREARAFLLVESSDVVKELLKNISKPSGKRKARKYEILIKSQIS
ncbi:nuclease-related domain-containing protein [Virgibacillus flavescens]|uniref:nuclease-related domain-containing protein n=1 Tax=Virgibacillus flavescens TaxID=1611422 RepID=UPI003D32E438